MASSQPANVASIKKAKKRKSLPFDAHVSYQFVDHLTSRGFWAASVPAGAGGAVVYQWKTSHWTEVGGEAGAAIAADWLCQNAPDKATANAAYHAWSFAEMRLRTVSPLPVRPDAVVIPLSNAYLEIDKSGVIMIKDVDPNMGLTYVIDAATKQTVGSEYIVKNLRPDSRFARYLTTSLPDKEIRDFVQEQCALTLLPKNYAIASWWVGAGRNGKSVMLELLERFHKRTARISLSALNDTFGMEHLIGASLILADEVENEKWNEGRFKSLISGNGVSINRKNRTALASCRIEAKWMISSNSPPFIHDKSEAVWARLAIVNWTVEIPEADRVADLDKIIFEEERNDVLDWLLAGAVRIIQRGGFLPESQRPKSIQAAKIKIRNSTDSIAAWALESGARSVSLAETSKSVVYESYTAFCENADFKPLEKSAFWRLLGVSKYFVGLAETQRRINGCPKRFVNVAFAAPVSQLGVITPNTVFATDSEVNALFGS